MKYKCHNRKPYPTHQVVSDGHYIDGYTRTPRLVHMPVSGSADCQYTHSTLGQADPRCRGCTWRHNELTSAVTEGQP